MFNMLRNIKFELSELQYHGTNALFLQFSMLHFMSEWNVP